ncbi:MAG: GAF domain-containing protein, partial [Chloroflexi bacterium]|nr:GAF domain-containing protein [Chloroflexota bacterium]
MTSSPMDDSQILEILANSRAARLRWLAFGLLAALYIVGNLFMQFHLLWLTALLGVAAISNSILAAIAARLRSPASPDRLTGLLYARITIDLLLLFSAIRITGGIESPFLFLLVAYLFVIGLDAGPRVGLVASASAMLGLGLNAYLEFIHVLPHLLIGLPFETEYSNPLFIYLNLIFIAAVIYFGLANLRAVTEKLRAREANLSKTKEQLEQRVNELDALRAIGAQLTASLNLETVLQAIGQNALELVKANDAQIFLYDFSSDEFGRGVGVWADPQRHLELAPPRVNGLTRAAAQRQAPILISNIAGNPFFAEPKARDWNLASIGSFPLIKNARVVGVMNISFQQPHAFTAEEQSVLMSLADHAALAIDNASLYVQAERRTNELTALYETSHAAAQMIAPEKLFERALD